MTVADRLRQTLVDAKSVSVQLEQFALDTSDKSVQQMYKTLSRQSSDVASVLQTRILAMENEEPTYQ